MSAASPYAARPWLRHYDYWVRPHLTYPGRPLYEILDTAGGRRAGSAGDVVSRRDADLRGSQDARRTRCAAALAGCGIAKGDRVGIMLPNCPQYIIAAFAILRLGAIVVNINPSYTAREVLTVADDSGMRMLITLDALAPLALGVAAQTAHRARSSSPRWRSTRPAGAGAAAHRRHAERSPTCSATGAAGRSAARRDRARRSSPCCSTPAARPARRRARC